MPVHNAEIAAIFETIADLLEIQGGNPFRVRAYRNAARQLEGLESEVRDMLARGRDLGELPGIGKDLAGKIREIAETGHCTTLDRLKTQVPAGLADLLQLRGLGPRRVVTLYRELGVHTPAQLARAIADGRLRTLGGFGAKLESQLQKSLAEKTAARRRFKLATAASYGESYLRYLRAVPGVIHIDIAGSFRRARETVGDLDILVAAKRGAQAVDAFARYDEVVRVLAKGPTRASVRLRSGLQVDLRVLPPKSYGAGLVYFTGSKAHNIAIRRRAQKRGLKINEYGVFRGNKEIAGTSEESVYHALGLAFVPPELREDSGEIEAAAQGRLPALVTLGDLKGDLHVHTSATDGSATIGEMAKAARARGFGHLAITEHSRHLALAHGLDAKGLRRQIDAIDRLNAKNPGIAILKGIEVDILEDGTLDLPDDVLGRLDLVVGAVHSAFGLSRARQTERILKAMDRPHFSILAHPSGRLIDRRAPYDVDMARIIRHAAGRGCFLEVNAHPERLDLLDVYCRMAKDAGVLVAINSDAHRPEDFDNLRFGIGQARRGWLGPADVLNARPLDELRRFLRRTM